MTNEDYTGSISVFAGTYTPAKYYACDGELKPVSNNDQLFAILGTTYGGDGRNTVGLPDLRGRTAMGAGNGPGLSARPLGQKAGTEETETTLTQNNLPPHTHSAAFVASALNGLVGISADWTTAAVSVDIQCNPTVGGNGPENCYPGFNSVSAAWSATTNAAMAPDIITNAKLTSMTVETKFSDTSMPLTVETAGDANPMYINNMAPYQVIGYVIMHDGLFPERN